MASQKDLPTTVSNGVFYHSTNQTYFT